MTLGLPPIIVYGIVACTFWLPSAAFAQDQGPDVTVSDVSPHAGGHIAPSGLFGTVAGIRLGESALPQRRPRGGGFGPVAMGALVGGSAALIATAVAARAYGENESGGFCGACLVQWSAFSVPVGAGIGAAIGYGVKRARPSVTAVPVISRKASAVVVTARF
jgi:hypothetical protein